MSWAFASPCLRGTDNQTISTTCGDRPRQRGRCCSLCRHLFLYPHCSLAISLAASLTGCWLYAITGIKLSLLSITSTGFLSVLVHFLVNMYRLNEKTVDMIERQPINGGGDSYCRVDSIPLPPLMGEGESRVAAGDEGIMNLFPIMSNNDTAGYNAR